MEAIPEAVTVDHAIEVLNRALKADPDAIADLIAYRVPCTKKLGDDPTIQVGKIVHKGQPVDNTEKVGILGLINGIFGVQAPGRAGWIAVVVDETDHRTVQRFERAAPIKDPPPARYIGSDKARQEVGDPGHCDRCVEVGHVAAHPDLGCGDVGCTAGHGPGDPP